MSYANCHLVKLSIKVFSYKRLNLATFRVDDGCRFTDVTQNARFEVVKTAKFCSHCDMKE